MGRHRQARTAREKIARVIGGAERQGLLNIASELRHALDLMADDPTPRRSRKPNNPTR
jgi:hypothetical protein